MDNELIYDLGMHTGKDTEFYLAKGFRVIGIEANPVLAKSCKERFSKYVEQNRLKILELAISDCDGECEFFICDQHDSWSTTDQQVRLTKEQAGASFYSVKVPCRRFDDILDQYGIPYYMKIDIEGADLLCLEALHRAKVRPKYASVELTDYHELFQLYLIGYNRFKIINQGDNKRIKLPNPSKEGRYVDQKFDWDTSGPFGEETPGDWMGIDEALITNKKISEIQKLDLKKTRSVIDKVRRRMLSGRLFTRATRMWHDVHAKSVD